MVTQRRQGEEEAYGRVGESQQRVPWQQPKGSGVSTDMSIEAWPPRYACALCCMPLGASHEDDIQHAVFSSCAGG